jgi:hypothetical protein
LWDRGIAQPLVRAVSERLRRIGRQPCRALHLPAKLETHPSLYEVRPSPALSNRIDGSALTSRGRWSRYSALTPGDRGAAEAGCHKVSDALYPGLDLGAEIRTVAARNLGDTLLLADRAGRLAGFAVCHWGPASEAGEGCCFVKFGAVKSGPRAAEDFAALLDGCRAPAAVVGMANLLAGVNLAREEAPRQMAAQGFRPEIQLVTLHRPNEPAYSRPGVYALDDGR